MKYDSIFYDYSNIYKELKGFFIIDKNEEVVYMGEDLIDELGLTEEKVLGKKIRDLIPTTKVQDTLVSGRPQIGVMYFVEGYTVICNSYPIYSEGELVGAFEFDIFSGTVEVEDFLKKVTTLPDSSPDIVRKINENKSKKGKYSLDDICGHGPKNKMLRKEIEQASKSNSTLLITGETGTGKELVAHAVHKLGHRGLFNFVRINCAAIPSELFESELFGYEKGSFTGASNEGKKGKAEIADNGTLFLDEVDSLSVNMQAKLLRFLQEREIYRVGGEYAIPLNVRIIAATNQDIVELVKEKKIRKDLYYRLNVLGIKVPPLRERTEDIPDIIKGIVSKLNRELDRSAYEITEIDSRIYPALMSYEWPGNVRELSNVIEKAMSTCYSHTLKLDHFKGVLGELLQETVNSQMSLDFENQTIRSIKQTVEKKYILYAIYRSEGNMKEVAAMLGISLQMLYRKIKSYGIKF